MRTSQKVVTFPKCPHCVVCRLKLILTKIAVQEHTHISPTYISLYCDPGVPCKGTDKSAESLTHKDISFTYTVHHMEVSLFIYLLFFPVVLCLSALNLSPTRRRHVLFDATSTIHAADTSLIYIFSVLSSIMGLLFASVLSPTCNQAQELNH